MSLERGAGAVLVGDLLDREHAPVGGAHEEPRELTKSRVAERLRRPNGRQRYFSDRRRASRLPFQAGISVVPERALS